MVGKESFQCHQGKDMNTKKKENFKQKMEERIFTEHHFRRTRKLAQNTKKKDCPVVFNVKKLFTFPNFGIKKDSRWSRDQASKCLKEVIYQLDDSKPIDSNLANLEFIVRFPIHGHKYHNTGKAAGIIEPLDPLVSDHLKKLIRGGCRRVKELESRALDYVKSVIFQGQSNPDAYRNRFYPERKKIRNLITFVKVESRYSKIDQENVQHFVSNCKHADIKFTPRYNWCINLFPCSHPAMLSSNKGGFTRYD